MTDPPAEQLRPWRAPLAAVEVLVAVAAHGSLSAAARALGQAQPSVSATVHRLEHRTGLTLVDRTAGGTRLTPAGERLLPRAREVLRASDALAHEVAALRDALGARVSVAASLSIAEYLVPGWLADRDPDSAVVDLVVANSRDVMAAVLAGRADLGFIEGPGFVDGLHHRVVGHDELVVVVAPGHPWARRQRPVDAAELAAGPLAVREPGSGTRGVLEQALAATGHHLHGSPAQLGSTLAVKNVVRGGRVAAVLSALTVADNLARGDLCRVPTDVDLSRTLRMVWAAGRRPSHAAEELARHVLAATERHPG